MPPLSDTMSEANGCQGVVSLLFIPCAPVNNPNKLIGSPSCSWMELSLVCLDSGSKKMFLYVSPGSHITVFVFFLDVNVLGSRFRAHSSIGVKGTISRDRDRPGHRIKEWKSTPNSGCLPGLKSQPLHAAQPDCCSILRWVLSPRADNVPTCLSSGSGSGEGRNNSHFLETSIQLCLHHLGSYTPYT